MLQNVDRESTILGIRFGQATGANEAYAQAQKNVMGARTSATSANAEAFSNFTNTLGQTTFPKYNKATNKFEGGSYTPY